MRASPRAAGPLLIALSLGLAGCGLPEVSLEEDSPRTLAQNSVILASDGTRLTTLHAEEDRVVVPIERIPKVVKDAVVAVEDQRFWQHRGVDLKALLRAAYVNASEGQVVEGGSTITQQYVKNTIVGNERTLRRKVREARLAWEMEKRYTKKEILGKYLNTIYFGKGAYGIQAAARKFFSKRAWELGLPEAALLAAMIASPGKYDPFRFPEAALARRSHVLARMAELGMIEEEERLAADAAPLGLLPPPQRERYPAAYFVEHVKEQILTDPAFGRSQRDRYDFLFKGGLRIETTIDLGVQRAAEEAVNGILSRPGDPHGALVAIEPATGHVKAMVGGRDFFSKRSPVAQVNLATGDGGTGRQAGSSFKPFALVSALESGISPQRVFDGGTSITIPLGYGTPWTVQNYEGSSYGDMTLEQATVNSVNVVYAQLIMEVGAQQVAETAYRMGIRSELRSVPSAVLGTNEVNPLEMASAYGTLAANGTHVDPVAITRITNAEGRVVYEAEPFADQVLNPGVAWVATQILRKVVLEGTGIGAALPRPVAGKTGTAQEWRDAWFVGYVPQLVASVWVGFPQGQISMVPPRTRIRVTGGSFPAQIWHTFMTAVTKELPVEHFDKPSSEFVELAIDVGAGCVVAEGTVAPNVELATFVRGTEPPPCPGAEGTGTSAIGEIAPAGDGVPAVVGMGVTEAVQLLEQAGYATTQQVEFHASYPSGTVIRQYPAAGTASAPGTPVTLVVSTQDAPVVVVPSVLGKTEQEAGSMLGGAGFEVTVIYATAADPKYPAGAVIAQSPKPGKERPRGTTVTITVNPGVPAAPPPSPVA